MEDRYIECDHPNRQGNNILINTPNELILKLKESLAFLVLITGIVGGLLIVFSILLLCKYCFNRKGLREAEEMKLLYERLNQESLEKSNRFYREVSRLEPRRSNPFDRSQLINLKVILSDSPEVIIKENVIDRLNDIEHYLQVDPRCYVRQNCNHLIKSSRRSELSRLEKGHSLNVDRYSRKEESSSSSSLSPYRQSSFDVHFNYSIPSEQISPPVSTQQDIYFTPRGSSLSVLGNTSTSSQHISSLITKKNSPIEKKDINTSDQLLINGSLIVQREDEHSHSLEQSSLSTNSTVDKQSRSSDAVNLLRPVLNHRCDLSINRRTKSYEYTEEYPSFSSPSLAPPPIVIRIPDMKELVQDAQLSHFQNKQLKKCRHRLRTLPDQMIIKNHSRLNDRWYLNQSYEIEEEEEHQFDRTSPEDFSPDFLTSTSIDSAGAMAIEQEKNEVIDPNDNPMYLYRRKSSSNLLLLPPSEVRRQALRRTYEKRRNRINQSNARKEEELNTLDDDYNPDDPSSTIQSNDFSSLLNNFNSKSANSSFDRSLETDFDMQSESSSRGPNDHFTSIESSGNEYALVDGGINPHLLINDQTQEQSTHQDDSGYKSLESPNSPNHTFSLDWISADGGESVIDLGDSQQKSQDIQDLEEKFLQNNSDRSSSNLNNNLLLSNNRSASRKRQEFGKDKHHVTHPHYFKSDDHQFSLPTVHQIDQLNIQHVPSSSSSSLQVRYHDFRRSKSDDAQVLELTPNLNEQSENINTRSVFQRSPSSVSPSIVTLSPQILAFRSKGGSISFDNPIRSLSPISSIAKILPSLPDSPSNITKPRLKFSMVRDSTTGSLGSRGVIPYSTSIKDHLTIDEKTNRIINEYLIEDKNNQSSLLQSQNHPEFEVSMNTNDHHINQSTQLSRTKFLQERHHSFIQPNPRPSTPIRYPSLHLENRFLENEHILPSRLLQHSVPVLRRDNGMSIHSPSIILTGYDSGS